MSATNSKTFSIIKAVTEDQDANAINVIDTLTDHVTIYAVEIPQNYYGPEEGQFLPTSRTAKVFLPNGHFIDQEIHIRTGFFQGVGIRIKLYFENLYVDGGVNQIWDTIPTFTGHAASVWFGNNTRNGETDGECNLRWTGSQWLVLSMTNANQGFATGGMSTNSLWP